MQVVQIIVEPVSLKKIYIVSLKEAKKAASVDASVRKLANKTATSYEGRAPSKTDIFSEAMGGKKYLLTVGLVNQ